MNARHAKALFQLMVGAGQAFDIVAQEETRHDVSGDLTDMRDGCPERSQLSLLVLHRLHKGEGACAPPCLAVLGLSGQDLGRLAH